MLAIASTILLSTVLGSIHAFSVFVPEWERMAGASRASVSLIYSTALVTLTLAVLLGYRLYGSISPAVLFVLVGVCAAAGLWLSAVSNSLIVLYIAYGILFGGANGLGYGYALQLAAQVRPSAHGLTMGLVTAFYAVGASVTPKAFALLIAQGGNALALQVMSLVVLSVSVFAAGLLNRSTIRFVGEVPAQIVCLSHALVQARSRLWLAYGCAVTAGLMVIGHSYSIAIWAKLNTSFAVWAATIVALGNMLGGFSIVIFADRCSSQLFVRWLPVVSALGLMLLLLPESNHGLFVVFVSLALVGFSYGAIIAVYPVAILEMYGAIASPRIYGQIFTAWGIAGLLGPWASGWLFDITQSYSIALVIAVLLSGASVVAIRTIEVT